MAPFFGNSTVSGISGNFSGKFLHQVPLLPNFRKFSLNWKAPQEVFEKFNQAQFPLGSKVAIWHRLWHMHQAFCTFLFLHTPRLQGETALFYVVLIA